MCPSLVLCLGPSSSFGGKGGTGSVETNSDVAAGPPQQRIGSVSVSLLGT